MRIIDAHHHFWDPVKNNHPWLNGQRIISFRYGDYSSICRPFMPADYSRASKGWDIAASVTMEGEWDPNDPMGEAAWMQQLHKKTHRPQAHAAQVWLDRADRDAVLEYYKSLPLVKSVRHKPTAPDGAAVSAMTESAFIEGYARLAETGLAFELQVSWRFLDDVRAMRRGKNGAVIILNHAGLPADRSAEGITGWRAAMARFSELDNVRVKISGLGLVGPSGPIWPAEQNFDIVRTVIDLFGPKRVMFASNFPVDGLCADFHDIFSCYDEATRDFSAGERADLFCNTAEDTYGISLSAA